MAANDFYNPASRQQTPAQAYNYQAYNSPAPQDYHQHQHTGPAPSYHSQAPSRPGTVPPQQQDITSPISPFEAPFDDHVYPMNPQTQHRYDSESSLGQDSRYYGQGGGGRVEPTNSYQDDIPLRDHPGPKPQDSTDHVYDATYPVQPARLEEGQGQGRSQKRMSGMARFKTKGRIPWVTYILTIIQVAVFIAEIIKNGKPLLRCGGIILTFFSPTHRIPHRNPPLFQPHDRTLSLCPHKHGSTIRTLHALRRRDTKPR